MFKNWHNSLNIISVFRISESVELSSNSISTVAATSSLRLHYTDIDLGARARASGSQREMGRARASEIFPVSERQYI